MTAVLTDPLVPGSRAWLSTMSASKIAAVLGLSPWESPFSLWHRMAGNVPEHEATDEMRRGHYLEPAIVAWFADQHPDWTIEATGTWTQDARRWQTASPDRLITRPDGTQALLECKSDAWGGDWGKPHTDQVPPHVRAQCIWQMDTTDRRTTHIAVITGGLEFAEYEIGYSTAEAQWIRGRAEAFMGTIERGERPDIDSHTATYQTIRDLHPDIDPDEVELDDDVARRYIAAKAAAKAADAEATEATSLVADAMGTARRATWDGITVATRQTRNGGVPYVVAGRRLPDLTETAA